MRQLVPVPVPVLLVLPGFRSGVFEAHCSRDMKVQGALGPCASLERVCTSQAEAPLCLTLHQ